MSTIRVPYSVVDILVLRLDPSQKCPVQQNQTPGATHVKIWRTGQPAPEIVRNEDVMPMSAVGRDTNAE